MSVDMAKSKSVSWPKKFDPRYPKRGIFVIYTSGGGRVGGGVQGGGEEEGDVVAGIHLHYFICRDSRIKLVYSSIWMLYQNSCTINGLTVAHFS